MKELVKFTVEVEVDVHLLGRQFAELTDDAQAQVLCIAAGILGEKPGVIDQQGWRIGRHLATCDCSTEQGREFLRSIHEGMAPPSTGR